MEIKQYKETVDNLIDSIKEITGVDIFKNTRERNYIEARSLFYHTLRNDLCLTYPFIVRLCEHYGFKTHHATILHALKNYDVYMRFSPFLRQWQEKLDDVQLGEKYKKVSKLRNKIYSLTDEQLEYFSNEIETIVQLNEARAIEVTEPQTV